MLGTSQHDAFTGSYPAAGNETIVSQKPKIHDPAIRLECITLVLALAIGCVVTDYVRQCILGLVINRASSRKIQTATVESVASVEKVEPPVNTIPVDARQVCLELTRRHQRPEQSNQQLAAVASLDNRVGSPPISTNVNQSNSVNHWSFIKPYPPRIPIVQDATWCKDPIDDFVLLRLETEELLHSREAERVTLIRRAFFDLIGLPPIPDEVEEFVTDTSPDAYERLVDRLLASPHFGEKWAIRWLDLARYADTNGFEFDGVRTMWLYRDWVIESLNRDLPFDQFVVEQIAGDLIPNASVQQKVATGFIRCSAVATDVLSGRFDMLVDRVNTLGSTWLGLTFSCAQCHDHKFDPLTQKEYFQLLAMFNNSVDEVSGVAYEGPQLTTESPLNGLRASTLVLAERRAPNSTFLNSRGSNALEGEPVEPGLPAFLHAAECGVGNRLALACWLTDDDNPLTARVTVNRIWESLFGIGLVRTSDDFGLRGERPSHPELLDWLATEFRRGGWSSKRILRQIVTSATYRQSSGVNDGLLDRDRYNRLLARGPRFRVDAELIRDIALAASGLLSRKLGGPSVFPWQPPGTSERLEYAGFKWKVNPDENRFRRGLYTHWKRTALYPSFSIFDAPNRTGTCSRRTNSCTPLQALVTLNDPVFFEAAVHLAKRMLENGSASIESKLTYGFRLCLARNPAANELDVLRQHYYVELQRLSNDFNTSKSIVGDKDLIDQNPALNVSEWAAFSMVATVILNLDETISKE